MSDYNAELTIVLGYSEVNVVMHVVAIIYGLHSVSHDDNIVSIRTIHIA